MRNIKCNCGKMFRTYSCSYVVLCPYCSEVGLNFGLNEELKLNKDVADFCAEAIWLGLLGSED